ncbi:MAG: hypothetical protein JXA82_03550, partial [Sedimentisphaerales bacterium]|nr:hypothetical protein [Sedimentisphaerales bacterium]
MKILDTLKRFQLWRFGWHVLIALLAVAAILTSVLGNSMDNEQLTAISKLITTVAFWVAFFAFLLSSR